MISPNEQGESTAKAGWALKAKSGGRENNTRRSGVKSWKNVVGRGIDKYSPNDSCLENFKEFGVAPKSGKNNLNYRKTESWICP